MSATFDVIPVIEQGDIHDRHEVQVALTPNAQRQILRAFARSMHVAVANGRPFYALLLAAGTTSINADQSEALDKVEAAVGSAWATLTVSPDEATAVGHSLLEAAEPPAKCEGCGHVIDSDMTGNECRLCVDTPRGRRSA